MAGGAGDRPAAVLQPAGGGRGREACRALSPGLPVAAGAPLPQLELRQHAALPRVREGAAPRHARGRRSGARRPRRRPGARLQRSRRIHAARALERQVAPRRGGRALGVVEEVFARRSQRQQRDVAAHLRPRRRRHLLRLPGAGRASLKAVTGLVAALLMACGAHADDRLRVGSKRFTESYILGEIIARTTGGEHRPGLGNTGILVAALRTGAIDLYPEYTGTIAAEVVRLPATAALDDINRALEAQGLRAGVRLGFNNSYALAAPQRVAVTRISELKAH